MFLKKICIFLACAFLAVDIFLLSLYIQANHNLKYLSDNMINNAVEYYNSIGVELNEDLIVREVPDNKIYTFLSDNKSNGMNTAERIAEQLFSETAALNIVETPEGPSYSIIQDGVTAASFRVYSDSFGFEFVSGGFSADQSSLSDQPFSNVNTSIDSESRKALDEFISALSAKEKLLYVVNGSYTTAERCSISIELLVDNKCRIDEMFMNLVVEQGMVIYAKGNIILADISKNYSEQLFDGVNALNKVDASDISKFVSEEIVYTVRYAGNGVYYLLPVWKIEYIDTDGKDKTQYIDAVKG